MKNFVVNPQSRPIKSNSEYTFLFKYVSSKIQRQKFSKYRKKPYFGHTFVQTELFLETLAMYNCRDTPAFKCQRFRVDWLSNQKLFITTNMQKWFTQSAQFVKSFVRKTWFKSPMIYKASPNFDYAHPLIIKATISFSKFVWECKKSAHFIYSFLR